MPRTVSRYHQRLYRAIILLIALVSFLSAGRTAAQTPDRRLSPGRLIAEIPADALVESAAAIDERILAVWGSSRQDSTGRIAGTLWYQFIVEGRKEGEPLQIPDASPSRIVSVQAVGDRFVLVWSDRRDSIPALYSLIVDTAGTVAEQQRLWTGEISAAGATVVPIADGYRIFWSAVAEDTLRARRLDTGGRPVDDVTIVGAGAAGRFIQAEFPPGHTIVEREGALPLLLDASGEEYPLGAAAARLARPYAIGTDGSLALLQADTLSLYRSILDTVPIASQRMSYHPEWIRGSEMIQRDSLDRVVVLYAVGGGAVYGPSERLYMSIYAIGSSSADTLRFEARRLIARRTVAAPARACDYQVLRIDSIARKRGIGGHYDLSIALSGSRVSSCTLPPVAEPVSVETRFHLAGGAESDDSLLPPALPRHAPIRVERPRALLNSTIIVAHGSGTTSLVAPSALVQERRREHSPGITAIDGKLFVAWISGGVDTLAQLEEWNPRGDLVIPLDSIDLGRISVDSTFRLAPLASSQVAGGDGFFHLATEHTWNESNDRGGISHRRRYSLMLPTAAGWRPVIESDVASSTNPIKVFSTSYDYRRNETLIAWGHTTSGITSRMHIDAFDTRGERSWGVDSVALGPISQCLIAPVEENDFVYVYEKVFIRLRDNRIIDEVRIAEPRGGTFLSLRYPSIFVYNPAGVYLDFRLFDIRGNQISITIQRGRGAMPDRLCIVQDPVDSTIIVLYGGNGVTMARFGRDLRQIGAELKISSTGDSASSPSALFRGDTLYVVWEDYRGGVSSIHGRAVALRPVATAGDDAIVTGRMGVRFLPNPATDAVTLMLQRPAGDGAVVEIFDALGRIVMRHPVPVGATSLPIEISGLSPGLHHARLREGERIETIPLMVTR